MMSDLDALTSEVRVTNQFIREAVHDLKVMTEKHEQALYGKRGLISEHDMLMTERKRKRWKDGILFATIVGLLAKVGLDKWH